MSLTFEDVRTLQRLISAAESVCTITANGELFAACDGAEPQRTTTVAALDELEHAHEAASAVLGSLILRTATPICDDEGDVAALQLPDTIGLDMAQVSDATVIASLGLPLPAITDRQSWSCANGCGACTPVQVNFEYSRTEDMAGNLIESRTEKVWVSNCCAEDLLLWDEDKQDFVEWNRPTSNQESAQ